MYETFLRVSLSNSYLDFSIIYAFFAKLTSFNLYGPLVLPRCAMDCFFLVSSETLRLAVEYFDLASSDLTLPLLPSLILRLVSSECGFLVHDFPFLDSDIFFLVSSVIICLALAAFNLALCSSDNGFLFLNLRFCPGCHPSIPFSSIKFAQLLDSIILFSFETLIPNS